MILRALSALWTFFAPPMADHLWQSTLFVTLAAILAFALRKNQGRVRYWVWLTASIKFLLPFSLLIALGSHLAKPRVSTPAQAVVYSAVEDFSQPFAGQEMPMISEAAPSPAPVSRFHLLPPIIVAVWLAGILVVLLVWAAGWIRVSLMVRRAVPLAEGPEIEALRRLESSLGVGKPIKLVLSRNWMEPGIFGILRPVLIWPEGISQNLDDRHVEAILAHEICHARRHDNLTAILHMLVEAVFWFHPLVWWMGARLEEERERACDEEVSLICRQPHVYAESILRVCKFCSESPLACVSGITGADLKKRIVQIMTVQTGRKLDLSRKLILCVAAVMAVALPVTFGLVHATQVRAQSEPAQVTGATPVRPMAAEAHPSFAVATIKPHDPASNSQGFHNAGDRISIRNENITSLMMFAYSINKHQVIDLPAWAETSSYDIEGKTDIPGEPNLHQQQEMIQNLLADRFHLKIHREQRELRVYAIQVAKGGAKLKPAAKPEDQPNQQGNSHGTEMTQTYTNCSIPNFILGMQFFLDRPVVDQTGLMGHYDFTFRYTSDEAHSTDPNAPPGLFTAVQEQLGLKFEPTRAPVDVFVLDHVEKPSVDGAEVPAPVAVGAAPVAMAQEKAATTPTPPEHAIKFDVVSIRQNRSGSREMTRQSAADTDNITMTNVPLALVVFYAYWINDPNMILGVPDWAMTERYDVVAKVAPSDLAAYHALPNRQRAAMLQAVLADRFKLQVHHESKDSPVYALVVAKGGPKLKDAQAGEAHPDTAKANPNAFQHGATIFATGSNQITGEAARMGDLAVSLSTRGFEALGLGRPVIDKTGLTGRYDFVLQFPLPGANAASTEVEDAPQESAASLSNALQDQLGLKLQSATAPTDYLVIDHVERPSAN